jgi:hypothetical protein
MNHRHDTSVLVRTLDGFDKVFRQLWNTQKNQTLRCLSEQRIYPQFYTREDWDKLAKVEKRFQVGEAIYYLGFVETAEGVSLDGKSTAQHGIRKLFIALCYEAHAQGAAPSAWSAAQQRFKEFMFANLSMYYPELTYCLGMWKLDLYCSASYSDFTSRSDVKAALKDPKRARRTAAKFQPANDTSAASLLKS